MKIQLLIEVPGRQGEHLPVIVEDTWSVRACAAHLARRFGCPLVDGTGTPMIYQLFSLADGRTLSDERSLADLQVGAGTCLLLACTGAQHATLPIARSPLPVAPILRRRWSRRSVLTTAGILGGCAFAGLASGGAFAFVSRAQGGSGSTTPMRQISITLRRHFTGHQKPVRTVAWSPDGTLLASGGEDAQVLVWSSDGMTRTAIAHQAPVQSLAWSPEGTRLVTGSASQVRFFSALAGSLLAVKQHRDQVNSVAWSSTGPMLAASGSTDRRVIVWETKQYQVHTIFAGHTAAVQAVSFDASGQTLASSSLGGAVRVWAAATGGELHPFYLDTRLAIPSLAFAPAGGTLAAGGTDGMTRLWHGLRCQATGASDQGQICVDAPERLQLSKRPIRVLAWSPDARYLASGHEDGTLALWQPGQSRVPALTMTVQPQIPVSSLTWSPDGRYLATASGARITLWQLQ